MKKYFSVLSLIVLNFTVSVFFVLLPPILRGLQGLVQRQTPLLEKATTAAYEIIFLGRSSSAAALYPTQVIQHLHDVHRVLIYFLVVSLGALVVFSFTRHALNRKMLGITALFFALFSTLSVLMFSSFFEVFHRLFFPQGNYQFAANSLIIRTFPPDFWLITWVGVVSLTFLLLIGESFFI